MKILVTGGAGFIGSALIRQLLNKSVHSVVNVDKLTYAGNLDSLAKVEKNQRYAFEKADICDRDHLARIFRQHQPEAIMHLAAESHVDRSIDGPAAFLQTNIIGTGTILEVAREYWYGLEGKSKDSFLFHHISTDEVFGDLEPNDPAFTESHPYGPRSPYAASKASSDHLVRAWHHTYGLPTIVTNTSNNYGPYQFPEKLIPLMILNALEGKNLPVYGDGHQIRDWLYVEDHAEALQLVIEKGQIGQTYNIGGDCEVRNIDVVKTICAHLEDLVPEKKKGIANYSDLITFVKDRPGHDQRYAIDGTKMDSELGWKAKKSFKDGLRATIEWYLDNSHWCQRVQDGSYQRERLGNVNKVEGASA